MDNKKKKERKLLFVANDQRGNQLNVAEKKWTIERLRKIRENSTFICPQCQNELDLKIGSIISAHFAHKKHSDCPSSKGGPESQYHMRGKLELYDWLQIDENVIHVELEPFITDIKQRPDLLINDHQQTLAIEYQCSPIDLNILQKRSVMYKKANIPFLWILGGKLLKRTGERSFQLSQFQWRFTSKMEDGSLMIYAYCSNIKAFIIIRTIIPFSSQVVFANQSIIPKETISFTQLIKPQFCPINFYENWFHKVRTFRLKPFPFTTKQASTLNQFLYQTKHTSLLYLPSHAFLPLKFNYLIESPVFVWQGWVMTFIDEVPLNSTFTFHYIYERTKKKVKDRLLSVRVLPQINVHYSQVIYEYLEKLSELSFITKVEHHIYIKQQTTNWVITIDELLNQDEELMKELKRG